jgi:hypothetical protein
MASITTDEVVYPDSDGRPLGETGFHVDALFGVHGALRILFAGRDDVFIASNMFLYYEEGNPKANTSPDCMVIFGVPNRQRRTFKVWVEGTVPAVVFELSSDETYREDVRAKRELYERLGISEYFLFDPVGDCLAPRLQGFRLEDGRYVPLAPGPDGGLTSPRLGVRLVPEGTMLRLVRLDTGEPILTRLEAEERLLAEAAERDRERRRAEKERSRADALAAEVERLKALLEGREEAH